MFVRHVTPALVAGLGLSLAGCPSGPSNVPANVPLADLPTYIADGVCDLYASCNPLVGLYFGSGEDCSNQLAARFADGEIAGFEAAVADGTVIYHGDLVDDCLALLATAGCSTADPLRVCEDIFEGTVADGGACERNEECAGDAFCAISTSCPGTCQARAASGGSCAGDSSCAAGLVCQSGTCRSPAGAGAACNGTTGVSCAGLAYDCVGDDGATPGTCQAWNDLFDGALDEPCDPTNDDYCDEGLSCAFEGISGGGPTFHCTARVAAGAECTIALPDQCPDDQFCDGVDFMTGDTTGTCTPLPTAGADCAAALPIPRCASGYVCIDTGTGPGTCQRLNRVGDSCTGDNTCASGFCMGGTCVDGVPSVCR